MGTLFTSRNEGNCDKALDGELPTQNKMKDKLNLVFLETCNLIDDVLKDMFMQTKLLLKGVTIVLRKQG